MISLLTNKNAKQQSAIKKKWLAYLLCFTERSNFVFERKIEDIGTPSIRKGAKSCKLDNLEALHLFLFAFAEVGHKGA